ncbi:MAG: right-handed parallel beta-helix repeat-containing protein [Coriobacteriia bacterium]|nr:right-handed parallel beta-helix repeat-containing protein [Coriobacteriia bacterium]
MKVTVGLAAAFLLVAALFAGAGAFAAPGTTSIAGAEHSAAGATATATAASPLATAGATLDVTDPAYGAVPNSSADSSQAFNKALLEAGQTATADAPITVYVPSGTYYLDADLGIYSNTTLQLAADATLVVRLTAGAALVGHHFAADGTVCPGDATCTHGGYTQLENVALTGGTWDRNSASTADTSLIMLRHGTGISITNTTLTHCTNHFINTSGCENVTITNVTCKDAVAYTGQAAGTAEDDVSDPASLEAIHLDVMSAEGETQGYPFDNTPCKNVTVSECTFDNVFAGVGNHHPVATTHNSGISVLDCTFNVPYNCVNTIDFDSLTISGNTVNACQSLTEVNNTPAVITNNTVNGYTSFAVQVHDATGVQITGNTFGPNSNSVDTVQLYNGAEATVSNNQFGTAGNHAVSTYSNSKLTAAGNIITAPKKFGFYVTDGATATLTDNTISAPGDSGIVANGTTVTATGNTITRPGNVGLLAEGGATLTADDNEVTSAGSRAVQAMNSKLIATNNTLSGGVFCVMIEACPQGCELTGNKISGSSSHAVSISQNSQVTLVNNEIDHAPTTGVRIDSGSKVDASENTITSPGTYGVHISGGSTLVFTNNTISDSGDNAIIVVSSTATVNGNKITSPGNHGIYACQNSKMSAEGNEITNSKGSAEAFDDTSTFHELVHHAAQAPTCTAVGWDAYDTCAYCNYTTYKEIPAAGHKWDAGVVTKQPTPTQDGVRTFTCTVCGATKTEVIPRTVGEFTDVSADDFFYKSVYQSVEFGLFSGYTDTSGKPTGLFGPWDPLTRGQFAVVLWRWLEPEEAAAYDGHAANATGMPDVADDAFYTGAVNWAVQKGYITGYAATGTFGPNDKLSAEMLCVILCRIQGGSGDAASLPSRIADADQVSIWARSGCAWALENGVLSGYENEDGTRSLRPGEDIFRGRAATILVNAINGGVL